MPKTDHIELGNGDKIAILYEDRSVMAIDKPRGWMLVPHSWQKTNRNLAAAITSSIIAGHFWARSRNLKFLRNIHRLDAETSGILLMAKSPGAINSYGDLFESRDVEKYYLAVVDGVPKQNEWTCTLRLAQNPDKIGRMIVDNRDGKDAETSFRVLQTRGDKTLIEAHPITGRTHQIRVHLAESGYPIAGDPLYGALGKNLKPGEFISNRDIRLGLRAVYLAYRDPFTQRHVRIRANTEGFIREFGFDYAWQHGVEAKPEPSAQPQAPVAKTGANLKRPEQHRTAAVQPKKNGTQQP